jgi:hypothetical protein
MGFANVGCGFESGSKTRGLECGRVRSKSARGTALAHDPEKAWPGLDSGWVLVSRLREALRRSSFLLEASAGEARSEQACPRESDAKAGVMRQQEVKAR